MKNKAGRHTRAMRGRVVTIEAVEPRRLFAAAMTFVVTNASDAGAGSLRQAIIQANANLNNPNEADTIAVNIAGAANRTIALVSPLPTVTDAIVLGVDINGVQPSTPKLELNGAAAGAGVNGLVLQTSGSTVTGVAINRFSGSGVVISGNNNVVNGANIGTDLAGTATTLGNAGNGVTITGNGNVVAFDKIAFNGGNGIDILSGTGNDLSFSGGYGQIYSNGGLGIDLGDDGITPNDLNDTDTGTNRLQNTPVLTAVSFANGKVTVSGTLNTTPNAFVFLDFFANPTGVRQGFQPLALRVNNQPTGADVVTDAQGNASFGFTLEATPTTSGGPFGTVSPTSAITAVATAFDNLVGELNSSEFSAPIAVPSWLTPNSAAAWNASTHTLTVTGAATIVADPGPDVPVINAASAAAVLTINPASGRAVHLAGLNLTNGASATLASLGAARTPANHRVLVVNALAVDNVSTLDLTDNDLIVDYPDLNDSPVQTVEAGVRAGYHVGDWLGKGIRSSVAQLNNNYHLGVADNALLAAPFGTAQGGDLFAGQDIGLSAVLVKFTHRIDLNLDGIVNASDATIFGTSYNPGAPTAWYTGDLDMDSAYTPSDATLFGTFYDPTLPLI